MFYVFCYFDWGCGSVVGLKNTECAKFEQ